MTPFVGRYMPRRVIAAALAVALSAAGVTVVVASIPDAGTGVFHGCVNNATGILRAIDPSKPGTLGRCITSPAPFRETEVSWNQAGVPGPEGEPGEDGTNGQDGQDGADGASIRESATPTDPSECASGSGQAYEIVDGDGAIVPGSRTVVCDGTQGAPGQDGQDGADGAPGQPGDPGPPGSTVTGYAKSANMPANTTFTFAVDMTLLTMDLPAGTYMVFGTADLQNGGISVSIAGMSCRVGPGSESIDVSTIPPNSRHTYHPIRTIVLASPGSVTLTCSWGFGNPSDSIFARAASLHAIELDSLVHP